MKYALKFTPGSEIETTMWVWFQTHGTYYVNDRGGIVHEADPDFLDSNLKPDFTETIKRVPFSDLPDHVQGHDPRDIVEQIPRTYAEGNE